MNPIQTTHPDPVPDPPAGVIPLLDYQREDVASPARFRWNCWSRQVGKSFTKSLRRLLRGLARGRNQVFLSAGERQSRELMLKTQQHCRALNIACRFQNDQFFEGTRYKQLTIELPNGLRIIGLPANPLTARGFTGDVFLDEFAMHGDDREIWAAIFPTLLRGDGELDIASTPKGLDNLFAELRHNERFEHSVVTLDDAVAAGLAIDPIEIRESMQDEELYRQEFGCAFLDEAHAFLTHEQLRGIECSDLCKLLEMQDLRACDGDLYCGVDIGRMRDLTVMWVLERVGDQLVTRGLRESRHEPFRLQWAALKELLALPRMRRCCIDAGGIGMPLAEAAQEAFGGSKIEPVTFTAAVKDEMATRLRVHVEDQTLRIPADDAIRNDFHSIRRSVTTAGPARYEAARGGDGHADRFWAACLAVRAAASGGMGPIEMMRGASLRFERGGIW